MESRLFKYAISPIGGRVENYLVENAKDILKPKTTTLPPDQYFLEGKYARNYHVDEITINTDLEPLKAHRLTYLSARKPKSDLPPQRKAIIYLPGNCPAIMDSLPNMLPLMEDMAADFFDMNQSIELVSYCQHYRGRGANQHSAEENFNDYTMLQDAKDQAELIRHLVTEGYQPKDILLIGYSYGSAVALWAANLLNKKYGKTYSQLKFYSDRGFGNLFEFRYLKPLIYDQETAHQRLHEKEMMPKKALHDVLVKNLPNSIVFNIENDLCIWEDYSLAYTFKSTDMHGHVFTGCAEGFENSHFADRGSIHLKHITQIQPHHLMTALLLEKPIDLLFPAELPVKGYALREGVAPGHHDYLVCAPNAPEVPPTSFTGLPILATVVSHLIGTLDDYCHARAARASASELGPDYNHAWFAQTGLFGWSARQQIEAAIQLMKLLCEKPNPNVIELAKLKASLGPHQSGELKKIFDKIILFIDELQLIKRFNYWVSMISDKSAAEKLTFSESDLTDWNVIENYPEEVQNIHSHSPVVIS